MARSRFSKFQSAGKKKNARKSVNSVSSGELLCKIEGLSHEGRGVAKLNGKTQFVEGALPGETVNATYIAKHAKFDELVLNNILDSSPDRVEAPCAHFGECGGCSLQHMTPRAQLKHKESVLKEQLQHFGKLTPKRWFEALESSDRYYRSKARLGVYYDKKSKKLSLGFRAKSSKNIVDIQNCMVLDSRLSHYLGDLRSLVALLSSPSSISHIEAASGEDQVALLFRHTQALQDGDKALIRAFAEHAECDIYLQSGGIDTVLKFWPENSLPRLSYSLAMSSADESGAIDLRFHPKDFTQVNRVMNQKLVAKAIESLDLNSMDRVLDLFCGLGNFTLPIAKLAGEVVGVEGSEEMVLRGRENAELNGIQNVSFHVANLQKEFSSQSWSKAKFSKVLIDPPRSGALDIVKYLSEQVFERIVYISCNPATLARDAGVLVDKGYTLSQAGVIDMFPHTSHVESIVLFERTT